MKYRGNPHRTALHSEDLPDGDMTPRQRALADAVKGCGSLHDFVSAPKAVATSIHVVTVKIEDDLAFAARKIEDGIAAARREIDRIEAYYRVYGVAGFAPVPQGVPAVGIEAPTRHGVLTSMLRRISGMEHVLLKAGDRRVTRDASGAYEIS